MCIICNVELVDQNLNLKFTSYGHNNSRILYIDYVLRIKYKKIIIEHFLNTALPTI